MSLPNSHLAYNDCYELMKEALKHPNGTRASMGTESAAVGYRIRMNKARQLNRKMNAGIYPEGHAMHGCSVYDELTFLVREDTEGNWWLYLKRNQKPATVEPIEDVA